MKPSPSPIEDPLVLFLKRLLFTALGLFILHNALMVGGVREAFTISQKLQELTGLGHWFAPLYIFGGPILLMLAVGLLGRLERDRLRPPRKPDQHKPSVRQQLKEFAVIVLLFGSWTLITYSYYRGVFPWPIPTYYGVDYFDKRIAVQFFADRSKREVAVTFKREGNHDRFLKYTDCTIVNKRQWSCPNGGEVLGMSSGMPIMKDPRDGTRLFLSQRVLPSSSDWMLFKTLAKIEQGR